MPDCMSFPDNIMDFIDDYSFEDSDQVYTNGSKLIQSFRVKQAVEHYLQEQEPVAPIKGQKEMDFHSDIVDAFYCGNCRYELDHCEKWRYCPKCGKEVKWK